VSQGEDFLLERMFKRRRERFDFVIVDTRRFVGRLILITPYGLVNILAYEPATCPIVPWCPFLWN